MIINFFFSKTIFSFLFSFLTNYTLYSLLSHHNSNAKGYLDILCAPPNRPNNPPRVKAFIGRMQGGNAKAGPIERTGCVRIGDLLLSINNKKVNVKTDTKFDANIKKTLKGKTERNVVLQFQRPKGRKKLCRIDSCGNTRNTTLALGPAYTANELSVMMDGANLQLEFDRKQYGPAFDLRKTVYQEFGETKEVSNLLNGAFGLPVFENENERSQIQEMNLYDPIFCISCSTLWREVCLQVKRWLEQNNSR